MRAVLVDAFGPGESVRVGDVDGPTRLLSEVLVDVKAAGLNPIDLKTVHGRGLAGGITSFPWIPGSDFAGTVASSPYELHELQPGDAVFGMADQARSWGSFAEQTVASSLSVARKPESLTFEEAAAVPIAALTAWDSVVRIAKAHTGQRILIHAGAGGVGQFAVQFGRYFGAHVIATASEHNLDLLRDLGAAEVVDYRNQRFEDAVQKVDVVVDLIGNVHDDTGTRSLNVLKSGGLYINVPTGSWPEYPEAAAAAGLRSTSVKVEPDGANLGIVGRLIDAGDVRVEVDTAFSLENAQDAFDLLETGHVRGKVVLTLR